MHNSLNHANVVLAHTYNFCLFLFDLSITQSSLTYGRHMHSHSAHVRGRVEEPRVNYCSMLRAEIH